MDVTIEGIRKARQTVYAHLRPTPLLRHPLLDQLLGCSTYVKHENHNPTGSFKIRGGLNLISGLSPEEQTRGVATATRGNHGQSIALASRIHGVKALVAVPEGNNPEKNDAMEALGAELLVHGRDFDEAREKVEEVQRERELRYIHSANEPALIHGVGTYSLEILDDLPAPDYIFVPLGGGSGLSSVLTVFNRMSPKTRVIGVQAANAASLYLSWRAGRIVTTETADTIADGLATRVPFETTFSIIRKSVREIVTVTEEEIAIGIRHYLRTTHNLAEGAAAAPLAAACNMRSRLSGKTAVLVFSGGNIDSATLSRVLSSGR